MGFSPETKQALEDSGWYEGRRIDISEYEIALAEGGYKDGQAACDFLRCYGGLEVDPGLGDTYINTSLPAILKYPVSLWWMPLAGRNLYSIGECVFEFMTLLMDSEGRVYRYINPSSQNVSGYDLLRIADSGEEAIEKLVQEANTEGDMPGECIAHRD